MSSSPSRRGKSSASMDPGGRFEVEIFQKCAQNMFAVRQRQWKNKDGSFKSTTTDRQLRQFGWLHLAAFCNPVAALQFRKVAQIIENLYALLGPIHLWDEAGELPERQMWCNDPISYLEGVQFKVPRLLTQLFQDWQQSLRVEKDDVPDLRLYEPTFEALRTAHETLLRIAVVELWDFLHEKFFAKNGDAAHIGTDPFSGLAAADHIFNEMNRILGEMEALLQQGLKEVPAD